MKPRFFRRMGFGRVTFSAQGGRTERLLTLCMERQIQLVEIRPEEWGFSASVSQANYETVERLAAQCRTRLQPKKPVGPLQGLGWLKRRPGLWLGPLIFVMVVRLGAEWIWTIRLPELSPAGQATLRQALYRAELYEGARADRQKLRQAARLLVEQQQELGWIALNFSGGRLVVERTRALEPVPVEQPDLRPIVAAEDAVILSVNAAGGFPVRQAGQTVAKGELLVSPCRPARSGEPVWQEPAATVIGLVVREYTVQVPLCRQAKGLTGRTSLIRSLRTPFGDLSLPGSGTAIEGGRISRACSPLRFLGLALPATLEETLYAEVGTTEQMLPPESAKTFARYEAEQLLYGEYPDAEIVSRQFFEQVGEQAAECTLRAAFRADIARKTQE